MIRLLLSAALALAGLASPALAQNNVAVGEPNGSTLPPEFRGKISYFGNHSGEVISVRLNIIWQFCGMGQSESTGSNLAANPAQLNLDWIRNELIQLVDSADTRFAEFESMVLSVKPTQTFPRDA